MSMMQTSPRRSSPGGVIRNESTEEHRSDLELKREYLLHEYELAQCGLASGRFGIAAAISCSMSTMALVLVSVVTTGVAILSGGQLVITFIAMIAALVVFFAFVFGRAIRIRLELSEVERRIDVEAGQAVR